MPFAVYLTADAARDLEELHQYIILHDAPGKAEHVLANIEKAFSLAAFQNLRSAVPIRKNFWPWEFEIIGKSFSNLTV